MAEKDLPSFDEIDETHSQPKLFGGGGQPTETIDLAGLFDSDDDESGSFDVSGVEESSFGKLLNALPLPALLVVKPGRIAVVNEAFGKISPSYRKLLDTSYPSLFPHPTDSAQARTLTTNLFVDRKPRSSEAVLQVDRNRIWARINMRSVRFGRERAILVLIEDLTEEKRRLILNEKYRKLVNIFPIGIAEFTFSDEVPTQLPLDKLVRYLANARITDGNAEFARLHGREGIEQIKGRPLVDFMPLNSQNMDLLTVWIRKNFQVYSRETREENADGTLRYLENTIIGSIKNNRLNGLWILRRDITGRKQSEEELHKAYEMQRQLLATAATGIFTIDSTGTITDVNDEFGLVTGYDRDEIVGQSCRVIASKACEGTCRLFDSGQASPVFRLQTDIRTKDGRIRTVLKNADILRDAQGNPIGGVESFVDVTELIEARLAAEAASKAKSNFLATMSHEIRTPLNGIIAGAHLALSTELTGEQRDYLNTISRSSNSLLALINDILDFSSIEAGRLTLEENRFNPRAEIPDLLRMLAVDAGKQNIEPAYRIDPSVPRVLVGDQYRLRQVLLNLLGNAIKFTDRGNVDLEMQCLGVDDDGAVECSFAVRDTGIGIPMEKQREIFQAFKQVDSSSSRRFGGVGLGLAISNRLVDAMGGVLAVTSVPGEGSSFHFSVRFSGSDNTDEAPFAEAKDILAGKRALIVDHNPLRRTNLRDMLVSFGIDASMHPNPEEAFRIAQEASNANEPFHFFLIDAGASGADGFELADRIQNMPGPPRRVCIMLDMAARVTGAARARKLGLFGSILKPVKETEVLEALVMAVQQERRDYKASASVPANPFTAADRRLTVLLAEDNYVNRKIAVKMLEKRGHNVFVAVNGAQAVEAAFKGRFDVILMDVQMPEMDGIEATHAIRTADRPDLRTVPIVAMTAHALKEDRDRCLESGMTHFLTKPINPEQLFQTIESACFRSDV